MRCFSVEKQLRQLAQAVPVLAAALQQVGTIGRVGLRGGKLRLLQGDSYMLLG